MSEESNSVEAARATSKVLQAIPGLQVLRHYQVKDLGPDFLAGLVIAKRVIPKIPPLVPVFFIALLCGYLVDFDAMGVAVIGEIRSPVPHAVGFTLELDDIATLAVGALGLSMLIFPEGVLLGRAMAEKHDYGIDANRELVALGSANIASALFQGFAIGGSQTRTLVNSASGGRTQVANVSYFIERLQGFIDREQVPVRQVVIDARAVSSVDFTAVEKLRPFLEKLGARGIELVIAKAHLPLRESPLISNLVDLFPEDRRFPQVSDAVATFEKRMHGATSQGKSD